MLPDRVSNPGPLTYASGVLPIVIRGPALQLSTVLFYNNQLQDFFLTATAFFS